MHSDGCPSFGLVHVLMFCIQMDNFIIGQFLIALSWMFHHLDGCIPSCILNIVYLYPLPGKSKTT